jgi:hypothetical protein
VQIGAYRIIIRFRGRFASGLAWVHRTPGPYPHICIHFKSVRSSVPHAPPRAGLHPSTTAPFTQIQPVLANHRHESALEKALERPPLPRSSAQLLALDCQSSVLDSSQAGTRPLPATNSSIKQPLVLSPPAPCPACPASQNLPVPVLCSPTVIWSVLESLHISSRIICGQ